jgi:hypothetical protein
MLSNKVRPHHTTSDNITKAKLYHIELRHLIENSLEVMVPISVTIILSQVSLCVIASE